MEPQIQRLKAAFEKLKLEDYRRIGSVMKFDHGTVRGILEGKKKSSIEFMNRALDAFPISSTYIYTGEGEPLTGTIDTEKLDKEYGHVHRKARQETSINTVLCEKLRDVRKELGFTQIEFAESISTKANEIPPYTVGAYENLRQNPNSFVLKAIAIKHNVSMDWLIADRGPKYWNPIQNQSNQNLLDKITYLEKLNKKLLSDLD